MIQVLLPNGKIIVVAWMSVAQFDGVLRFNVINADPAKLIETFTNPENCSCLVKLFDGIAVDVYTEYTVFRGITINYDKTAIVALSRF